MLNKIGSFLLELLFPSRCPWCEEVLAFAPACACEKELLASCLSQNKIMHGQVPYVDAMWACYGYGPPVSEVCHRFKYEGQKNLAAPLGKLMAQWLQNEKTAIGVDVVVAVPLSKKAERRRGFNQSECLVQELCKNTGLKSQTQWLKKTRDTRQQRTLPQELRRENVKGVFAVSQEADFYGKTVMIIDDVLTTGSTLSECAKVIKEAGAKQCIGFTLLLVQDKKLQNV